MEFYVGIDVSKEKLDTHVNYIEKGDYCFENSKEGIKKLIILLKNFQSKGHVIKLRYPLIFQIPCFYRDF